MTTSVEQIVTLYRQRKAALAPVHSRMVTIRDQYANRVTVPLPELDKDEVAAVANLISQGVDQMGMRVASTVPNIVYPPTKAGNPQAEEYARVRRLANYGWWEANRFDRKQRKRSKWLVAYAVAPALIRPDFARGIPRWQLPDPLCTFPGPTADPDDICPPDAILAYKRALSWLSATYPSAAAALELGRDPSPDTELEVLEYIDADEHVLVAVGRDPEHNHSYVPQANSQVRAPGAPFVELERFVNKVGRCTLTYPTRPSLECPISQFDAMPGVYRMQARAMALWVIANERAIFPEVYAISRPSEQVEVLREADGRAGVVGEIKGGDLHEIQTPPAPQIATMIDTLERVQRVSASLSSDFGGEAPTNVRTGRAGEQLLSATVDYWVQEAQETLGLAYQEENKLAVAVARTYFGDTPRSFYVNFGKTKGPVDYTPLVHFDTDNNVVSWPMAGSDINQLVVGLGQRIGLDEISIRSAQEKDPYIDDPEEENRRLTAQSVNKAFMASVDQAVAAGQVGPTELARFVELVETGRMNPYKAWQTLHDEAQQNQAAAQQTPEQGGPQPGSPEAMPGLAAPGQQAAQGLPAPGPAAGVAAPQPGVAHMQQLISSLRGGAK